MSDQFDPSSLAKDAEECAKEFQTLQSPPFFCSGMWDGILCWPPTMPGMTIKKPCPPLSGFNTENFAFKTCGTDGNWFRSLDTGQLWTNYTMCIFRTITTTQTDVPVIPAVAAHSRFLNRIDELLNFICHSVSFVSLLIAITLFGCTSLRKTKRYKILVPLFTSAMVFSLVSLIQIVQSSKMCKSTTYILYFSDIATYSWLVVLGLTYLMPIARCTMRAGRLLMSYMVGFGIPAIFTSVWLIIAIFTLSDHGPTCSMRYSSHESHWIIDGPKLAALFVALCLFITCASMSCSNPSDDDSGLPDKHLLFSRGGTARGLIFLILATAGELYLTISAYVEHGPKPTYIAYIQLTIRGILGFLIAILLCFLDREVWCCMY